MWLHINEPRRLHRRRFPVIEVLDCISLPYGVVTLSDYYNSKERATAVYHDIRKEISTRLIEFSHKNGIYNHLEKRRVQMIGTSGTVTTLAAINMGLERYDRRLIDGVFLDVCDIHNICKSILDMTIEERSMHPCIGMGRSDLVIMGTAILEGICDTWPVQKLRVADRGVREGILMELLKQISPQNNMNLRFIKIKA
jgi:exopolyphosphatase/guanosine-5'-triphosphate,3'-diphosphate pyrophosphatase